MKTISSLILSVALASSAFAGPVTYSGKDSKVVPPTVAPAGCDCFAPGFALGLFGGGELPRHTSIRDNGLGGCSLAEYFFTENIGLQASYGVFAPSPAHHIY